MSCVTGRLGMSCDSTKLLSVCIVFDSDATLSDIGTVLRFCAARNSIRECEWDTLVVCCIWASAEFRPVWIMLCSNQCEGLSKILSRPADILRQSAVVVPSD